MASWSELLDEFNTKTQSEPDWLGKKLQEAQYATWLGSPRHILALKGHSI